MYSYYGRMDGWTGTLFPHILGHPHKVEDIDKNGNASSVLPDSHKHKKLVTLVHEPIQFYAPHRGSQDTGYAVQLCSELAQLGLFALFALGSMCGSLCTNFFFFSLSPAL